MRSMESVADQTERICQTVIRKGRENNVFQKKESEKWKRDGKKDV